MPSSPAPRKIELLAPARDASTAIEAILHGADAVYIGGPAFGARASATNTLDDISRVVECAHPFRAKVYATLNTIIYEHELAEAERLVKEYYRRGVDALIVQDLGMLRLDIPPIALHASTQCDIRTPEKARFLQDVGFSQLVIARELSLQETEQICQAVSVPVEVFIHGALCVSYSGDCQASCLTRGRSANRGECAQLCRLPYTLRDGSGRVVMKASHLLSLRDLNRSALIHELLHAGVSSFKIEGRLKDAGYVKNVVAAYRRIIDDAIAQEPHIYERSSYGSSTITFTPNLEKSFNRGFTTYFTTNKTTSSGMASLATPKWQGEKVGRIQRATPRYLLATLTQPLANGDGLGYFDPEGRYCGFRLNRVDGNRLFPATAVNPPVGAVLYRNHDKEWQQRLQGPTAQRRLKLTLTLKRCGWGIALIAEDERGCRVSVDREIEYQQAKQPQEEARRDALSKTGGTIYEVTSVTDIAGNLFIPISTISSLRRECLEALDRVAQALYPYDYRLPEKMEATLKEGAKETRLTYHDNVSNSRASDFYRDHGAREIQPALEVMKPSDAPRGPLTVMTTRYCLRRELGHCLKTPQGREWPEPLTLQGDNDEFLLRFDCKKCQMHVDTLARMKKTP